MSSPQRVYVHVGVPKTGTTYLQHVFANSRSALADQGLLYPGRRRDHFLEAQDVLDAPFLGTSDPRVSGSWAQVVQDAHSWPGSTVISHELLAAADDRQVARIARDLQGLDVHVLVTVRDLLRQVPAVWQESLKNGGGRALPRFVAQARARADADDRTEGFWTYQDVSGILRRWTTHLPRENVVVVTVPPSGSPRSLLWERVATVIGADLEPASLSVKVTNESLGAAEAEWLRHFNRGPGRTLDRAEYLRTVKARLVPQVLAGHGRPIVLPADDAAWAVAASEQLADDIAATSCRVVGSLDDLRPKDPGKDASPPTDRELIDVGTRAVAELLARARPPARPSPAPTADVSLARRARSFLRRTIRA